MGVSALSGSVLLLLICTCHCENPRKRRPEYVVDEIPPPVPQDQPRIARIPISIIHGQNDTNVTFNSHNKNHSLTLEPNDIIDTKNIPVRLLGMNSDEEAKIVKEFQDIELKKDIRYLSSMAFKKSTKQFVNGAFKFGNHNYHMNVAHDNSSEAHVTKDEFKFDAKLKDKLRAKVDKERTKRATDSKSHPKHDVHRRSATVPIQASIEIVYIVDYSMYNLFVDNIVTTDSESNPVTNLLLYVAHMATMIDDFYATMQNDDISIAVRLAGLIVLTSRTELATLTEDHKVLIDLSYKIDSDTVIENLAEWLGTSQDAQDLIPPRDHTMLLTAYNMYDETDMSDGTIGLAYLGEICSPGKGSSVIEMGNLLTYDASTAAHELGHNLGANHDDVASSAECFDNNFVMAAYSLNPDYLTNRFLFSCCSQRSFYGILAAANCTSAGQLSLNNTQLSDHIDQNLPGEIFDVDDQCYIHAGTRGCDSWAYSTPEEICLELWCLDPDDSEYCISDKTAAADGTSCGNSMWCLHGSCVSTAVSIPSTTDQQCDVDDCYGFEFRCVDGYNSIWTDMNRCIPESWRCDAEADCSDASDENSQMCDGECWLCQTNSACITGPEECADECPDEPGCETGVQQWLDSNAGRAQPNLLVLIANSYAILLMVPFARH